MAVPPSPARDEDDVAGAELLQRLGDLRIVLLYDVGAHVQDYPYLAPVVGDHLVVRAHGLLLGSVQGLGDQLGEGHDVLVGRARRRRGRRGASRDEIYPLAHPHLYGPAAFHAAVRKRPRLLGRILLVAFRAGRAVVFALARIEARVEHDGPPGLALDRELYLRERDALHGEAHELAPHPQGACRMRVRAGEEGDCAQLRHLVREVRVGRQAYLEEAYFVRRRLVAVPEGIVLLVDARPRGERVRGAEEAARIQDHVGQGLAVKADRGPPLDREVVGEVLELALELLEGGEGGDYHQVVDRLLVLHFCGEDELYARLGVREDPCRVVVLHPLDLREPFWMQGVARPDEAQTLLLRDRRERVYRDVLGHGFREGAVEVEIRVYLVHCHVVFSGLGYPGRRKLTTFIEFGRQNGSLFSLRSRGCPKRDFPAPRALDLQPVQARGFPFPRRAGENNGIVVRIRSSRRNLQAHPRDPDGILREAEGWRITGESTDPRSAGQAGELALAGGALAVKTERLRTRKYPHLDVVSFSCGPIAELVLRTNRGAITRTSSRAFSRSPSRRRPSARRPLTTAWASSNTTSCASRSSAPSSRISTAHGPTGPASGA